MAEGRRPVAIPMLAVSVSGLPDPELERGTEDLEQPVGHQLGSRIHGASVDEHDELVAAQTPDAVDSRAWSADSRLGHRLQELVAHRMAEGVIHILEPVEIDEQGGHLARRMRRARASICSVRSRISARLGSPVSASCTAWNTDLVEQAGIGDGRWMPGRRDPSADRPPGGDGQALGLDITLGHDVADRVAGDTLIGAETRRRRVPDFGRGRSTIPYSVTAHLGGREDRRLIEASPRRGTRSIRPVGIRPLPDRQRVQEDRSPIAVDDVGNRLCHLGRHLLGAHDLGQRRRQIQERLAVLAWWRASSRASPCRGRPRPDRAWVSSGLWQGGEDTSAMLMAKTP